MSDDVLTQILARLTGIETGQKELHDEILTSRRETSELIEGVQISLDAIRDDLTVIGSANDRVRKAGENTREEGREIADGLARLERILRKYGTRLDALERRKQ